MCIIIVWLQYHYMPFLEQGKINIQNICPIGLSSVIKLWFGSCPWVGRRFGGVLLCPHKELYHIEVVWMENYVYIYITYDNRPVADMYTGKPHNRSNSVPRTGIAPRPSPRKHTLVAIGGYFSWSWTFGFQVRCQGKGGKEPFHWYLSLK